MRCCCLLLSVVCLAAAAAPTGTVSPAQYPDRWFITPEVWPNPWENWQLRGGTIVTSHASPKKPMTLHHLTYEMGDTIAPASMTTTLRLTHVPSGKEGSAGFAVGIRVEDPIDDFRSRLLFGYGMFMGLNTKGELFIGADTRKQISREPDLADTRIQLTVDMTPSGVDTFSVALSAKDAEAGNLLARVEKSGVPAGQLVGNVALVANIPRGIARCGQDGLWAFGGWELSGAKFNRHPERAFGPILWSQYTLSDGIMKLTAQMAPIGADDSRTASLQIHKDGTWQDVGTAAIDPLSWTAPFRVENWDDTRDTPYRLTWTQNHKDGTSRTHDWEGTIRKDPRDEPVVTSGLFCCFTDFLFPNRCIAENVARQDPDVLMFVGDQIYENVGDWGILRTGPLDRMCVNYLRKLALWGWSFRDVMKDRPTITMPDDHDVYHGNIWGDAGRQITLEEWSRDSGYGRSRNVGSVGGYVQPIEFVKAVERTQVSHLPDPATTKTYKQGLGAYFTAMNYGRIGFAILEDRKFKTGPLQIAHRHAGPRPDHISEPDMAELVNDPNAKLLGDDQLAFLRNRVSDWRAHDMKAAVSQTTYCGVATHHGAHDNFLLGDMDCGGWPQAGRNKAVDVLRRGGVILLAGDQHLPTMVRQGIDQPGDGILSFVTPAGATGYQRWWRPEEMGMARLSGGRHGDRPNTGVYRDGFGNIIDVLAVGNPPDRPGDTACREELGMRKSAGWGLVAFDKPRNEIRVEAWRVRPGLDVSQNATSDDQFPGWPMTFKAEENYGVTATKLPPVVLETAPRSGPFPIVRVVDAEDRFVSAGRMSTTTFTPTVYGPGPFTVEVLSPKDDSTPIKTFEGIEPGGLPEVRVKL